MLWVFQLPQVYGPTWVFGNVCDSAERWWLVVVVVLLAVVVVGGSREGGGVW